MRPSSFLPLRPYRFCISTATMEDGLRQRIPHQRGEQPQSQPDNSTRDPVVLGKTPSGEGVHITDFRSLSL